MKIGFLSNKLTLRGTEVNLYDYADFSESILGHQSVILTRPYEHVIKVSPRDVHIEAYQKFQNRFPVVYYYNPWDIPDLVKEHKIDMLFIEKAGSTDDGLVFPSIPTVIHCVFTTKHTHGTLYTAISDFVNEDQGTNVPVLPNIVRVHPTTENLRAELGIPQYAKVFGTYSGADEFTIDYVKEVVVSAPEDIYFIFLNVDRFCSKKNVIFLPGTANLEYKRKFINTCDAMLYGRSGGETFGISIGEFSVCNKPVIGRAGEKGRFHEDTLGEHMIKHTNYNECFDIVTNWDKYKKDVSNNNYHKFSPENVMKIFGYLIAPIEKTTK
jgi:hypothetical protein